MKRVLARLRSGRIVEVLEVYENGQVFVVSLDDTSLDVTYRGGIGYTGTPARYIPREDIADAWITDDRPMRPFAVYDRVAAILAGAADYQPGTCGRCTNVPD